MNIPGDIAVRDDSAGSFATVGDDEDTLNSGGIVEDRVVSAVDVFGIIGLNEKKVDLIFNYKYHT